MAPGIAVESKEMVDPQPSRRSPPWSPLLAVVLLVAAGLVGLGVATREGAARISRDAGASDVGGSRNRHIAPLAAAKPEPAVSAGGGESRPGPREPDAAAPDAVDGILALHGVVLDEQGGAVPGAVVRAAPNTEGWATSLQDSRWETRADDRGRWTLAPVPAGRWIVGAVHRAWAPGYAAPIELGDSSLRRAIVIELRRGTGLQGAVLRARDGAPVVGATVGFSWVIGDVNDFAEVRTDQTGRFQIEHLPVDSGLLFVEAAGFEEWSRDVRTGEAAIEVRLAAPQPVSIRVRDARGDPPDVYGAFLVREYVAGELGGQLAPPVSLYVEPAGTDSAGSLTLRVVGDLPPADEVVRDRICILLNDGRHAASEPVAVPANGDPAVVEVYLPDSPRITGRVLDIDGRPIAGAIRVAYRPSESLPWSGEVSSLTLDSWQGVFADHTGRFTLNVSGSGPYELQVAAPDRSPFRDPRALAQPSLPTTEIEIRLP